LRGRPPGRAPDANNDVFHEVVCEDWSKRGGYSTRLFLEEPVLSALRLAAFDVIGCGLDVAWLTAVMGAMFRLFPEQRCIHLALKVACRDGPGELQMVGFLSEQRLFAVDIYDPETATLLGVADTIGAARRARAWRAPMPYEAGLTVWVNIVSAMTDGLPAGFRHVVRPTATPLSWRTNAYCHLNLRIDQVSAQEWDFRVFHWDAAWGWSWVACFADALGATIADMASAPTAPLLLRPSPRAAGSASAASASASAVAVVPAKRLRPDGVEEASSSPVDVAASGAADAMEGACDGAEALEGPRVKVPRTNAAS